MMKTCLICSAVVGAELLSCPECGECSFNLGIEPAMSAEASKTEEAAKIAADAKAKAEAEEAELAAMIAEEEAAKLAANS